MDAFSSNAGSVEATACVAPEPAPLSLRLRHATDRDHRRLEDSLALLQPPLSRQRFEAVLGRFLGFHRVWEPALAGVPALRDLVPGRSRLRHLEADLRALGHQNLSTLASCRAAAGLAATPARALGAMYVIEGSTLGGQVIGRALAQADWLPAGGLGYFHPYGERTGAMWRAFKAAADAWPQAEHDEVVAGARATFDLLRRWLTDEATT